MASPAQVRKGTRAIRISRRTRRRMVS
jgi:hypothetical protein